ncbi:hypothetical protein K470DRAFT_296855 [Piedraia hortae CBS 480.64]|uniref:G-patch domain-containing protein n=1 Tax=Piedraia hortae CBS 480.64 TaxID=1314780 RepID=A0A6A7BRC1_9PEZI|nr:hypothetical protein K470DRAFT_296855 [Piedraia hortae CBS 480.64]
MNGHKISLPLGKGPAGSKKKPQSALQRLQDDEEHVIDVPRVETITRLETGPPPAKAELTIRGPKDEFGSRKKRMLKARSTQKLSKEDQEAADALLGNGKRTKDDLVIPTEDNAFKRDVQMAVDVAPTLADYERVSVDDIGSALLRGMGWKKGDVIGANRKGVEAELVPTKKRKLTTAIGGSDDRKLGEELGLWGKKAKGNIFNPLLLKDTRTGEKLTAEEVKQRSEEAARVPSSEDVSDRRQPQHEHSYSPERRPRRANGRSGAESDDRSKRRDYSRERGQRKTSREPRRRHGYRERSDSGERGRNSREHGRDSRQQRHDSRERRGDRHKGTRLDSRRDGRHYTQRPPRDRDR